MSDHLTYEIGVWGKEERLAVFVTKEIIPQLTTQMGVEGIAHFLPHSGGGFFSATNWSMWPSGSLRCVNPKFYDEHRAELLRIAEELGIAIDVLQRREVDGQDVSVWHLSGQTSGFYPVDFAIEMSQKYPDLLFEVWGDQYCLSEGWWVVFDGHEHPFIYTGMVDTAARDGKVVALKDIKSYDGD